MRSNSSFVRAVTILGIVAVAPAVVFSVATFRETHESDLFVWRCIFVSGFLFATFIAGFARQIRVYYAGLVLEMVLVALSVAIFAGLPAAYVFAITFLLIEIAVFEPFPQSLVLSIVTTVSALVISSVASRDSEAIAGTIVERLAVFAPVAALALLGPFMTKYREMMARAAEERERLGNSVVRLTRANSRYQDFALNATEHATEQERLRITREIHDIVGYTLTNNIMLLEAALRIMEENVLALPSIIETARTNAKDGLQQIRSALYKLRLTEADYPSGIKAINRLARMFEQATGVRVRCEMGNLPWTISEEIDSILYHLVQESLVNAFRHGKATEVTITFWLDSASVRVKIDDNGEGATAVSDGIGLSGMKERIAKVNGTLLVRYAPGSFSVYAEVPRSGEIYENDANSNR